MSSDRVLEVAGDPAPPSPSAVRDQLDRMLRRAAFRSAPRMQDLLRYVVTEALAGHSYRINERTIAVEALGRPSPFDPRIDPSVRVLARRVRSALDLYYQGDGAQDPVRIEIPKGGYGPRFQPAVPAPLRLVAPARADFPRVAVAVFEGPGADDRPAAIAETVVAHLARLGGLRVLGPFDADSEPTADYLLRGSVQAGPVALRLNARLVATATGETIWSDVIEHPLSTDNPFESEDEVAAALSGVLGDYLGVIHRHAAATRVEGTDDGPYGAMLRYVDYLTDIDMGKVDATVLALERAVDREPPNAMLLAMLAGMYLAASASDGRPELFERAQTTVRRALALEPNSPHASLVVVTIEMTNEHPEAARAELDRLVPRAWDHPTLLYLAGVGYSVLGDRDRGLELTRRSMHLNPHHPGYRYLFVAIEEYRVGDHAAAWIAAQRVDAPGWGASSLIRAAVLHRLGRSEDAVAELTQAEEGSADLEARARQVFAEYLLLDDDLVERFLVDLRAVREHATAAARSTSSG